jgi:hypothetical protein
MITSLGVSILIPEAVQIRALQTSQPHYANGIPSPLPKCPMFKQGYDQAGATGGGGMSLPSNVSMAEVRHQ